MIVKSANEMLLLEISNSCKNEPVQKADGRFQSMKDGPEHGWGIESVRDIVKQHKGSMDITFSDSRFKVTILI